MITSAAPAYFNIVPGVELMLIQWLFNEYLSEFLNDAISFLELLFLNDHKTSFSIGLRLKCLPLEPPTSKEKINLH